MAAAEFEKTLRGKLKLDDLPPYERAFLEEELERSIDYRISYEPSILAADDLVKPLYSQILNIALLHSESVTEPYATIESLVYAARLRDIGGKTGESLFRRFPIRREITHLRRIPVEMQRRRKPKLIVEMDSLEYPTRVTINLRDLTAFKFDSSPLGKVHPLSNAAEIKFSQSQPGQITAMIGYEIDSITHKVIQPHSDKHVSVWKPMTIPQAKMLSRMLPVAA